VRPGSSDPVGSEHHASDHDADHDRGVTELLTDEGRIERHRHVGQDASEDDEGGTLHGCSMTRHPGDGRDSASPHTQDPADIQSRMTWGRETLVIEVYSNETWLVHDAGTRARSAPSAVE